ncbi:hypothetical protein B0H34DRAFT_659740 [Crassisporium funariophilum]|nr:hypothetical protein B0H34DRAFT_659740 [Crassisporium funariophilum]
MATLPRSTRYPPGPQSTISQRPASEFDAGINTSTAWTEHLEGGLNVTIPSISRARSRKFVSESNLPPSLSDDEEIDDIEEITHPARALFKFEGKAEFRELSVEAGDELEVVKEDVGDGWSLIRDSSGEVGLLPQSYYTLTSEFTPSPDLQLDVTQKLYEHKTRETSSSSITPRGSPRSSQIQPLVLQNTGEWRGPFPSFRQSLLGGKSINRFSTFVTSGAEAFILSGAPNLPVDPLPVLNGKGKDSGHAREDTSASMFEANEEERRRMNQLGLGEADLHVIDAGPAWKAKTPSFSVLVHSPSKRNVLAGAYTMYSITSIFPVASSSSAADWVEVPDPDDVHPPSSPTTTSTRLTVVRRFSHFVMLHTALSRRLPGIALPPLPEKQYAGRFSEDFVEARRGDLERYLNKIVRHPVVRYAEVVTFFLGCESDSEWSRLLPQHLSMPAAGPAFYARIYHPAFNVDLDDADEAINSFQTHTRAVGKGVQGLRSVFGKIREARIEMSKAERLLSYSLISLITSKPLASAPTTGTSEEDENYNTKAKGLMNSDGAWCWREGCADCLKLSKAMQKTSETLQTVANLYDGHARRTQLATHESLKLMAHPSSLYEGVITTHKSTLTRYREATGTGVNYADEDMASRCETVLNTTMAEMDTYHSQKVEDFKTLVQDHLDGEIAFYEQILMRLKAARTTFDPPQFEQLQKSPRQPSIYERELEDPNLTAKPLLQPCPHVYDSAPMRPVSVAIQEGVNMFLGPASGRGTVFGKFW